MRTWALVIDGLVNDIIVWDGPDANTGWSPPEGTLAIEYTDEKPAQIGWKYVDGKFIAPPPPVTPPPTAEEMENYRRNEKERLLRNASLAMTPAFMALQLGNATDEETETARAWQDYYRELKAVDVTDPDAEWPTSPETN